MTRKPLYPLFTALFIALLVLAPSAAQASPLAVEGPLGGAFAHLTEWFTALFGDVRCTADPSGGCAGLIAPTTPPTEGLDYRCGADPSGGCLDQIAPAERIDVGCSMDPSGGACGNHG